MKGQEVHLCMRIQWMFTLSSRQCHCVQRCNTIELSSFCIGPLSVPKVELGEWADVPMVELGEHRANWSIWTSFDFIRVSTMLNNVFNWLWFVNVGCGVTCVSVYAWIHGGLGGRHVGFGGGLPTHEWGQPVVDGVWEIPGYLWEWD